MASVIPNSLQSPEPSKTGASHIGELMELHRQASPKRVRYEYNAWDFVPQACIHFVPLAGLWLQPTAQTWWMLVVFYTINMFAITAGYHRYFSHRTYKTSRWFQMVLAWFAVATAQRGVLTWAWDHRRHHRYSDLPQDLHSPIRNGFWHAHLWWIYRRTPTMKPEEIRDLSRYPELRWLERNYLIPPIAHGAVAYLIGGWVGVCLAFLGAMVLSWHITFCINSLAHVWGTRRYATQDHSRNNWILALLTFGEGWHNNHHHYMNATRQGFFWWEVDFTYYVLWSFAKIGLVWDLKPVPNKFKYFRQSS